MNSFRGATDNSHGLDKITVLTVNPLNSSTEFHVAINLRQLQLLKKQARKNAKAREPASLPPPAHPGTAAQPPLLCLGFKGHPAMCFGSTVYSTHSKNSPDNKPAAATTDFSDSLAQL